MAANDDTAGERLHAAHANPLGRRFWILEGTTGRDTDLAELAGMLMGMHALTRVLANSEAFRGQCEANSQHPSELAPLDAGVTEGLFAALYFLSERAMDSAELVLEHRTAK